MDDVLTGNQTDAQPTILEKETPTKAPVDNWVDQRSEWNWDKYRDFVFTSV